MRQKCSVGQVMIELRTLSQKLQRLNSTMSKNFNNMNPVLKLDSSTNPRGIVSAPPSAGLLVQLTDMGFDIQRASQALIETGNRHLAAALDWLETHPDWEPSHAIPHVDNHPPQAYFSSVPMQVEEPKVESRVTQQEEERRRIHAEKERKKDIEIAMREKREREAEKERVRRQLEEDRLAREAKYNNAVVPQSVGHNNNVPVPVAKPASAHTDCQLQIRLPDGAQLRAQFKADDKLTDVHKHVGDKLGSTNFTLIMPFPRKEFTDTMLKMTLREADLVPRGTLTVLMSTERGVIKVSEDKPTDEEVNTDNMTYEQLLELGSKMGTVKTGIPEQFFNVFPVTEFTKPTVDNPPVYETKCLICQGDFEESEKIRTLPCAHKFHLVCIDPWLRDNKTCPFCYKKLM